MSFGVIKTEPDPTIIKEKEITNLKIQIPLLEVSPNPFTSVVSVKCQVPSAKEKISLNIYDISGRVLELYKKS